MDKLTIAEIFRYCSVASVFVPLLIYIAKIKIGNKTVHAVGAFLFVSATTDLVATYLANRLITNILATNIYIILQFVILTWFYYEMVFKRNYALVMIAGVAIYIISFILITLHVQHFNQSQTWMWTISSVIIMFYSVAYCGDLLVTIPTKSLFTYSSMWINAAFLYYFGFTLGLFVLADFIMNNSELQMETKRLLWSMHNVNNIIKNALIAVGLSYIGKDIS